jgi:hypothetical protein
MNVFSCNGQPTDRSILGEEFGLEALTQMLKLRFEFDGFESGYFPQNYIDPRGSLSSNFSSELPPPTS